MRQKQLLCILFLLVGIILLASCEKNVPTFNGYARIYIDSTTAACDVDSCVVNLPWLGDKIEAFRADSAERKYSRFETILKIEQVTYVDLSTDKRSMCFQYQYADELSENSSIVWLDCAGDTICEWKWKVPDENVTDTMYMTKPEDYFMEMLQVDILDSEIIVYLDFGYRPQLWCRKTKRNLNY